MTLVPLTGWRCLNCGHMTDRGFPKRSCCPDPVPVRALVEHGRLTDEERAQIAEARAARAAAAAQTASPATLLDEPPAGAADEPQRTKEPV